jgi:hypothetical protein
MNKQPKRDEPEIKPPAPDVKPDNKLLPFGCAAPTDYVRYAQECVHLA